MTVVAPRSVTVEPALPEEPGLAPADVGMPDDVATPPPGAAEAVLAEAEDAAAGEIRGLTVWFTGLPSSGKTTLARAAADRLADRYRVQVLDGDEMREYLTADLGFDRAGRDTNVLRIGWVARLLAMQGIVVLVPVIAPYAEARARVRELHADAGVGFFEVHVDAPVEVCAERDVKGLYARARAGEITNLTGVDDPYEVPVAPDLRIDTAATTLAEATELLLAALADRLP